MDVTPLPAIRVLLVDDHPSTRQGIRTMLEQAPDIEVVGEASDGAEAQDLVAQLRPDVVLLDVEMPGPRACEVEAWIRHNYPDIVSLVLSAHDRDAYLAQMLDAGAVGYLDKQIPAPQLVQAIRRARQGEGLFSVEQLHRAQRWRTEVRDRWNSLTPREQEVLRLLAQSVTINEIAQRLGISLHTVETHLRNTVHKLEVDNRLEAVTWAWVNGVIERPAPEK
ncbi:MAG: response regulator transcription factor [Anaerolineae bacterium]